MLGWLRRKEGFEWHRYVRTTIKLRREDRRRKAEAAGEAIVQQGRSAARGALGAIGSGASALARPLAQLGRRAFAGTSSGRGAVAGLLRRTGDVLASPLVRLFAGIIGLALAASAVASLWTDTIDLAAMVVGGASLVLLSIAAGPVFLRMSVGPLRSAVVRLAARVPWLGRLFRAATPLALGATAVLVLTAVATVTWQALSPSSSLMPSVSRFLAGTGGVIEGRGAAVGPDLLRVGDTLVRLAEIEAPAIDQRCVKPATASGKGRRQTVPCTRAAFDTLQARVKGQTVTCRPSGRDKGGNARARCTVAGADLAQELVRAGLAKAETGVFASYASDESTAKSQGTGLWAASGEAAKKKQR